MTNIEKAMLDSGLSVKEVAAKIGVSSSAVSQWAKGTKKPKHNNLLQLAEVFNCSVGYLMGINEIDPAIQTESEIDSDLTYLLSDLSKGEKEKVKIFVAGLRANRPEE